MRERTRRRRANARLVNARLRRTRTRGFRPRRPRSGSSSSGSRSGSVDNLTDFLGQLREEIRRKQAALRRVPPDSIEAFVLSQEILSLQQQEEYLAAELNPV